MQVTVAKFVALQLIYNQHFKVAFCFQIATKTASTSTSLSLPSMVESSESVYVQVTKPSGRVMTPVSWEPRGTFSVTAL